MTFLTKIYYYLTYTIYALYVIIYLNIWNKAPQYLVSFDYILKLLVGSLLVYYYFPFNNTEYTKVHRDLAFSAGIFLITSTTLNAFTKNIEQTFNIVKEDIEKII